MAKRVLLYKVLRRELGDCIASHGFIEVPRDKSPQKDQLVYYRETLQNQTVGINFLRDNKAVRVDAVGTSFTIEFFRTLDIHSYHKQYERIFYLLTAIELEEMRALQNKMIQRLPPLDQFLQPWEFEWADLFIRPHYCQTIDEPFNPLHDRWMRYRDEEDILAWTKFIERLLPSLVDRFLSTKSK